MIGKIISHYKIIEKLGEGGMDVVYKAEDIKLERTVAIKFLPSELTRDEEAKKRFIHEAKAASSLEHNNICNIHEIDQTEDGQLFVAMACYEGETLKEKIEKRPLKIDDALDISIQISQGLTKAHEKGKIHRDIKPSNIFVTNDGIVKIIDFGLAKLSGKTVLTKEGSTLGTVNYMSPEQIKGEEVDRRTDIWSLGIVLYQMITGSQPFKGDYDQAVFYSIINEEPEHVTGLRSGVPLELEQIANKALAKNPDDRYQHVDDLLADLRRAKKNLDYLKKENIKASGNISPRSEIKDTKEIKTLPEKTSLTKPIKNSILKWITTIAVIIAITVFVIFYFLINKKEISKNEVKERKMIVVMPFENLGAQEEKYFADGVTDEITNKLASIGNIGVISSSTAGQLAKTNKSVQEIGKELNVDYILNGTVRWAKKGTKSSHVKITPQLTRVSDYTITWSESYDRVMDDIFALQNEIAQKVVDQLGGSLVYNQIPNEKPPTANLDAYDFYLRGLSYESKGSYAESDILNSINLYKKALQIDPNFASAYAHLSRCQSFMFWLYFDRSEKNKDDAFKNVQKAFQLNSSLSETHLALGYFYYWCRLNYKEAIKEFSEARSIQPNNAEAYFMLGAVYRRMGNFQLAINNMLKGCSLNPLSTDYVFTLGETYGLVRNYSESIEHIKKASDLSPDLAVPKLEMAQYLLLWKGETKSASAIIKNLKFENYAGMLFNVAAYICILERKYDDAIREIKYWQRPYQSDQYEFTSLNQILGLIYMYKNETKLSKAYFDSSRIEYEKMLKNNPNDERLHSSLGITYAGLGLKDKAVYEGKRGIELLPIEKEAYRGYYRQLDMAKIYTLNGDTENALKQIDFILSIPGDFSITILKMHPIFDFLRNLPGYKAIIAKYSNEKKSY